MGSNPRRLILIGVTLLSLASIIYFLAGLNPHYIWSETYDDDGNQPYDLSLFKNVLESSSKDFEVLKGLLNDTSYLASTNSTLVFIGGYATLDSTELSLLKRFVKKGNTAFLSSRVVGGILRSIDDCDIAPSMQLTRRVESSQVRLISQDSSCEISYDVFNQPEKHPWIYLSDLRCYESAGNLELDRESHSNFVRKKMGDGEILLHTVPLVFTNYQFRRDSVFNYVNEIVPVSKSNKIWYLEPGPEIIPNNSNEPNITESPLMFILKHDSLRWAWYMIILLTLTYLLNNIRRKQRHIPIINLPYNQVKAYLDMIYHFFKKEGKHKDILQIQIKLLQDFLKSKYNLNAHQPSESFFSEASKKLNLDKNYLEQFFKQLERSKFNSTLSDADLIKLDQEITEFYSQCP